MYVSIEKVQVDKTTSATETKIEVRRCKCTFCQPQRPNNTECNSRHARTLQFIVGRVQIDNQLYLTPHPVVLLPSYNDEVPSILGRVSSAYHLRRLTESICFAGS